MDYFTGAAMDWTKVVELLIGKLDPTTIVLLILVAGCGWYHVIWRREDREDRQRLLELHDKQIEATNGLRNVLSAISGKVQ